MPNEEITNYIDFLLSAAMRKCDDLADAQDLVQETLLAALSYRKRGGVMKNSKAWLISVMNRKYYDLLRRKYQIPSVTIGDGFDIPEDYDISDGIIKEEQAELVRREVAFLAQSYRKIIVKYYFHNKSIKDIAEELALPEGTVKSRLDFGRKQMKKEFEKMEKYRENSYMPQHLALRNSGRFGINGEPMSLTEEDTLAQNLLILAYEKPVTVSELSKAIGVAAAYVEPIINKLVDGELMKRMGDGKIYTDFIIYHASDYVKYIKEAEAFVEKHIEAFTLPFEEAIKELKETSFYSERLERFMMIEIAQDGLYNSMESVREKPQIFPDRPNGGKWIAFATIWPENYTIPEDRCGKEEYGLSGIRCEQIDNYLDAKNLRLYNFETSLDPIAWRKHDGYGFNFFVDVEVNMLKFFYLLKKNIKPEDVDLDTRMIKAIPLLEERGYITTKNGSPELLIPVLTHAQEKTFFEICHKAQKAFGDNIREHLAEWCRTHKKEIPPHLTSVPDQKRTMPYEPSAMMFVYEAIKRGAHPRDLGYICPETIAVFD